MKEQQVPFGNISYIWEPIKKVLNNCHVCLRYIGIGK